MEGKELWPVFPLLKGNYHICIYLQTSFNTRVCVFKQKLVTSEHIILLLLLTFNMYCEHVPVSTNRITDRSVCSVHLLEVLSLSLLTVRGGCNRKYALRLHRWLISWAPWKVLRWPVIHTLPATLPTLSCDYECAWFISHCQGEDQLWCHGKWPWWHSEALPTLSQQIKKGQCFNRTLFGS